MESVFLSRAFLIATASALGLSLTACGGGGGEIGDRLGLSKPSVRFMNAAPDTALSLFRNGSNSDINQNNLVYGTITKLTSFDDSTSTFSVRNGNVEVGTAGSINPEKGHRYLSVAFPVAGVAATSPGSIDLRVLDDPYNRRASVVPTVRLVNAVPVDQPVDVYVTRPDQAMGNPGAPNFAYKSFWPASGNDSQKLDDVKGKFRVRITAAGNPGTILFDSQEIDIDPNADEVVAVVPSQSRLSGTTGSTALKRGDISLLINDGNRDDASRLITDRS
jgi:hypothetical protein